METYPPRLNGTARPAVPPGSADIPPSGPAAPSTPLAGETAGMQDLKTLPPATTEPAAVPAPAAPVQPAAASAPPAPAPVPLETKTAPTASGSAPRPWSVKAMKWVVRGSLLAAAVVAAIGFTGSYDALEGLAREHGFGWYAWLFPVGIDAGIIAMYGLDLVLVWRRMP
ncbi:DUF2637 domain-containing protein, partial [Streptomyces sp. NPDC058667]|uniref:DUF2637 domain-containing protein n=1 Tax=Streptomyces sp. NPDC058667 TaxID=3346588 RepID=UPI00365E74F0